MSKLFAFSGNEDFCPGGSIYTNPKDSSLFLPLAHQVDVYFPPRKRSRISAPFLFSGERFEPKEEASIDVLPDECLFEIFRRLPEGSERSGCACVSKRWLMLLSNIRGNEFCSTKSSRSLRPKEVQDESDGCLSRSLEGKKATDLRLAALVVGISSRGGLGKLMIHGTNRVTDFGLRAVSRGCPSLRGLSLWNVSSLGDKGLIEVANGCHLLEKLDISRCPGISDKALIEIAKNCPNLTDLTIESCLRIGNGSLQAIGKYCSNLKSFSIKDCRLVGDQGIASLLSSTSCILNKLKLQALNITDVSLAVIGHYGIAVTDLVLSGLANVSERGFWVMGNCHGLQKLKCFTITSCHGVTDTGLEAVAKGCPNLRQFCLQKCVFLSDNGLVAFVKAARSIESLQFDECHRITQFGVSGIFLSGAKLQALSLTNCLGIKGLALNKLPFLPPCKSLMSLSIRNCPGFGDAGLALLGKLCPEVRKLDLSGLEGISDSGFLQFLENCNPGLVKLNLTGCVNLTDKVVTSLIENHGWTLSMVNLDGCTKITDASLVTIAENCLLLRDLYMSECGITDFGISALARANSFNLTTLSVSGCSLISDKSFRAFTQLGDNLLLGLNLQHCNGISRKTVDLLARKIRGCDILF